MTVNSQRLLLAAAGAGAAAEPGLYVDDVFSCFLWDGHPAGGEQDIDCGIDLTEGGLVWTKGRNVSDSHYLVDSEIGKTGSYYDNLATNLTGSLVTNETYGVETFNDNGFTVDGSHPRINDGSYEYVSWIFRKAAGFFDVVKYSGNSTAGHNVAHDLGSVPGCIFIKKLGGSSDWYVYHRELDISKALRLNDASAEVTGVWNSTAPTSTHFTLANNTEVNESGYQYIAYIFAHDDQSFGTDSDEAIIKCGSFTLDGSGNATVDLGFEPQWLLIKKEAFAGWWLVDTMRGMSVQSGDNVRALFADSSSAESDGDLARPNATGFTVGPSGNLGSSADCIYIAIRRPHKPPEAGTDVFKTVAGTYSAGSSISQDFPIDLAFAADRSNATAYVLEDRLRGFSQTNGNAKVLRSHLTNAETSAGNPIVYEVINDNLKVGYQLSGYSATFNFFRRAPGFFDVVTYTGNGVSGHSISHNLGVAPELIIIKRRSSSREWGVASSELTNLLKYLKLNSSAAEATYSLLASPYLSSTAITLGDGGTSNENAETYIAYLFASLSGISKVGTYSGTGSNVGVDCGFTAGARFVLIKRTDSTGDWYVYDSARGIVGGNDPYKLTNSTAAEVTSTDYIDPLNSGFTVTSSAPAALNASGGTYIFLAIA